MISDVEIQNAYIDLYEVVRNYIWEYSAVIVLAELEIECFKRFFDVQKIRNLLNSFTSYCRHIIIDDEELQIALNSFYNILDNSNITYCKLYAIRI